MVEPLWVLPSGIVMTLSLMTYPWQFPESVSPHLEKIDHTQKVAFPRAAAISVVMGKKDGVTAPNVIYY